MIIDSNKAKMALAFPKAMDALVREYDVSSANALDRIPGDVSALPTVEFRNGVWVHFCRRYYYHSAGPFPTAKAAHEAAGRWNR